MESESVVTCMACRERLVGLDARREHYKTDLHRFNLQRKVAGLAPLSLEDFWRRSEIARNEEHGQGAGKGPRYCDVCSKKFSSERALTNHIGSRRHIDKVKALGQQGSASTTQIVDAANSSPVESDEDEEEEGATCEDGLTVEEEMEIDQRIAQAVPFQPNECVFDGHVSDTAESNAAYMAKQFGFFLPMVEHLVDLTGLLVYVGQKVGIGYACIECDHAFSSVRAAQQHMIDKQHCRMTSDDDDWYEEYSRFYNFSDSDSEDADGEWEEVRGEEAKEIDLALQEDDNKKLVVSASGIDVIDDTSDRDDSEKVDVGLVLEDKVIGHRSLQRYYRQRGQMVDSRDSVVINKLANDYRLLRLSDKETNENMMRAKRMAAFQRKKKQLDIGMRHNYTRKAKLRVPLATFNSGYRP